MSSNLILLLSILLSSASDMNPKGSEAPIQTSLCEIVRNPECFNGKMVQFRAQVSIGFESSLLRNKMNDPRFDDCVIWLDTRDSIFCCEYAEISSISDLTDPDRRAQLQWKPLPILMPVILKEDEEFRRLQKYLGKKYKQKKGVICHGCNQYEVTATVTGRFDYGENKMMAVRDNAGAANIGLWPHGRAFGHLNGWQMRLVLESVKGISVKRIPHS